MAVSNKYIDGTAELGRNPVTKHQIQLEYREMSRLTRDGTAKPVLRDQILRRERGQREMLILPVQLTTCRTGSRTRLIHILAIYVTILAHIQSQCVAASPEFYLSPGHFSP